jgi:hypothetical protein
MITILGSIIDLDFHEAFTTLRGCQGTNTLAYLVSVSTTLGVAAGRTEMRHISIFLCFLQQIIFRIFHDEMGIKYHTMEVCDPSISVCGALS